ncbi:MAG TPA: hypothetical protein VE981_19365, partial [Planctomycetota bacterium]|nr:hypothetical protein [Planctomycetota bacterium]
EKLAAYNDFLRGLAKEKKCLLGDLNAAMQKDLEEREKAGQRRGRLLTADGVHMNPFGNVMMASGVLRGFGLDDAQMAKATNAFLDIPNGVNASVPLTLRQYAALEAAAAKEGKTVQELLKTALDKIVGENPKKQN